MRRTYHATAAANRFSGGLAGYDDRAALAVGLDTEGLQMTADGLDEVWDDWKDAVNMTAAELEKWLETEDSKSVGQSSDGGEATGHRSGRRIVEILRTTKGDLDEDDVAHMRKVVGYVHRHTAQRPSGDVADTKWAYSLKNWGHDPTKR
jgi:hypothetical protein